MFALTPCFWANPYTRSSSALFLGTFHPSTGSEADPAGLVASAATAGAGTLGGAAAGVILVVSGGTWAVVAGTSGVGTGTPSVGGMGAWAVSGSFGFRSSGCGGGVSLTRPPIFFSVSSRTAFASATLRSASAISAPSLSILAFFSSSPISRLFSTAFACSVASFFRSARIFSATAMAFEARSLAATLCPLQWSASCARSSLSGEPAGASSNTRFLAS